jgi:hypothetical protein
MSSGTMKPRYSRILNKLPLFLIAFLLVSPPVSFAQDARVREADVDNMMDAYDPAAPQSAAVDEPRAPVFLLKKHSWEAGVESFYYRYREPQLMKLVGVMNGVYGSYTYRGWWLYPAPREMNRWMFRLEGRYSSGDLDYYGGLQDRDGNFVGAYDTKDNPNYAFEIRALEGYDFTVSPGFILTPYVGVGYRYLNDKPPADDPYGYERESNYYYAPIGVEMLTQAGLWRVGAAFEYDLFYAGRQYSHDALYGKLRNKQTSGYGLRASLKLAMETRVFSFVAEPFIRYWNIRESEFTALEDNGDGTFLGVVEPDNNTVEAGARLGLRF